MAKDRSTIRAELRNDLRIDPNGKVWSADVLNQLIHEGEIEVARRNIDIPELSTSTTFTTVIGDRSYDLPTDLCRLISVIYDDETVANYTASTIAFVDSNPDTITDTANGFVTAGFTAGMKLQIEGTTSNDNTSYTINTVAAGTLTLETTDSVTVEAAGSSFSLVGTTDPDHQVKLKRVQDIREIESGGFNNVLGYPSRYAVFDNDLYFDVLPKETDTVRVRYTKIPAEMSTDGTNSDIPDELIPLVRLWAEHLAWGQIPGEEAYSQDALAKFEREIRRKITMRGLNDYQYRVYNSSSWRNWKPYVL